MLRGLKERWAVAREGSKLAIFLVLVVSAALFSLLVLILRNWQGDIDYSELAPIEEERTGIEEEELLKMDELGGLSPTGRAILQKHFSALGGAQRIGSVISLLANGEMELATGERLEAVYIRKSAQQRLSIKTKTGQQISVLSETDAWRCRWRAGNLVEREDLDAVGRERLELSDYSLQTLYREVRESGELTYLGTRAFDYKTSHSFELAGPEGARLRIYIDPETFLDIGREVRRFDTNGALQVLRQVYGDRLDIGGIQVPGKITGYVDGILMQTFHIADIDLNVGIFDTAFERPTDALVDESPVKPEVFGGVPDPQQKNPARLFPDKL